MAYNAGNLAGNLGGRSNVNRLSADDGKSTKMFKLSTYVFVTLWTFFDPYNRSSNARKSSNTACAFRGFILPPGFDAKISIYISKCQNS